MKKLLMTAAILSFAIAAPAFAADTDYKSETTMSKDNDGSYKAETSTSATDTAGTTSKSDKKVKLDMKSDGDFKKTTETDSKVDPKGLFNTSKTSTKDTVVKDDGKITKEHKKEINGDTVEDVKTESNE